MVNMDAEGEDREDAARTPKELLREKARQRARSMSNVSSKQEAEWKLCSRILDRFFLIFFALALIISFFAIFMRAPRFNPLKEMKHKH